MKNIINLLGVADKKIRSIGISNYYTKEAFDKVMTYFMREG